MFRDALKWLLLLFAAAAIALGTALGLNDGFLRMQKSEISAAIPTPAPTVAAQPEATPAPTPTASPTPAPTAAPEERIDAAIRARIDGMTNEEKIGQLLLFGFTGTDRQSDTFTEILDEYAVGNLILYGQNVASGDKDGGFARCGALIDTVTGALKTDIPPIVAIDVEGGSVVRFGWEVWPSSARTLGRKNDPDYARSEFFAIGKALVETGIRLDLAPVLDTAPDPLKTFLGTRILSGDAEIAADMGAAIIKGLHDAGCLSAAKHFPGHGGTPKDSHAETPVVRKTADELAAYDLIPFRRAIEGGVDAVLVAHILFPALDEADIASQSEPIITGLLRDTLGFTGVVISDDFRMGGLTSRYDPDEAAVGFLLAGGDLIMCGAQPERQKTIAKGLTHAVADGVISAERLDESVYRVLRMKVDAGIWSPAAE